MYEVKQKSKTDNGVIYERLTTEAKDKVKDAEEKFIKKDEVLSNGYHLKEILYNRIPPENAGNLYVVRTIERLFELVDDYLKLEDRILLSNAIIFSSWMHRGQRRKSGDFYIVHPLVVAQILADMRLDVETMSAGVLHDVIEDTVCTYDDVVRLFGENIATLIDGVTKLSKIKFKNIEDYQAENLRKMFLIMAKDIRVVFIKLADRLHNMRTIMFLPIEKQKRIAKETLEIYAPLAHRLGIYHIKRQLEDLAFRILEPEMYHDLRRRIRKMLPQRESVVNEAIKILSERLHKEGIKAHISGRVKHYYSVYEKMKRRNVTLDQLYDLLALRVIVNTIQECYIVLGIVHTIWKPIPGQFDDYIANPKGNMYQSLHTTVVGPGGQPLEVQVRTWQMHRIAEYGVAAHWRYKSGKEVFDQIDQKLTWLRQMIEWHKDLKDSSEFMEHLKFDVLSSEVFVFTPKGDVKMLPRGSTPIDFAYSIHTEVGHRCVGAKVNDRIVPLDYQLKDGDRVQILTSTSGKPSMDWLSIVKTARAKSKIKQWFKQKEKEENKERIEKGKDILKKEIKKRGYDPQQLFLDVDLEKFAKANGYSGEDEMFIAIASGSANVSQLVSRLIPKPVREPSLEDIQKQAQKEYEKRAKKIKTDGDVILEGVDGGVLLRFAKCCNPVKGDEIVGYITRGRGISIHRKDCPNIAGAPKDRLIKATWSEKGVNEGRIAKIVIEGLDRPGLVADVTNTVISQEASILSINASVRPGGQVYMDMNVQVKDISHLLKIMAKINSVKSVLNVYRG